jgi:hypothetical protein
LRALIDNKADVSTIENRIDSDFLAIDNDCRGELIRGFKLARGWTEAMMAAEACESHLQRLLQGYTPEQVNAQNADLRTALHYAAEGGHEIAVRLLVSSKADVNAKGMHDVTPLHLACRAGSASALYYCSSLASSGAAVPRRTRVACFLRFESAKNIFISQRRTLSTNPRRGGTETLKLPMHHFPCIIFLTRSNTSDGKNDWT